MRKNFFCTILVFTVTFLSCKDCDEENNPIAGCTDSRALNSNFNAVQDDGSCIYSNATFYASASTFNGIPIVRVDVNVNGNNLGSTNGTFFPSGPGNCSVPGTIPFQFQNGENIDWNATVILATGATIITSGTARPSSISNCIKVNITK